MQKNYLYEIHGAIDIETLNCEKITSAITKKIANIFKNYNENSENTCVTITNNEIVNEFGNDIYPYWLQDVNVNVNYYTNSITTKASVALGNIKYTQDNKLTNCIININISYDDIKYPAYKSYYFKYTLKSDLIHEFRHAYQLYMEKIYNYKTKEDNFTYNMAKKITKMNLDEPYKDIYTILNIIKKTFYYIDKSEIDSYIQQFKQNILNDNSAFPFVTNAKINDYIETGKFPYNSLTTSSIYEIYKFLYDFWKNLEQNIDYQTLLEIILQCQNIILVKKLNINKFYTAEEYKNAFFKLKENILNILENVLHKFACIYYDEITKLYESIKYKLDEKKKNEMLKKIKMANRLKNTFLYKIKKTIEKSIEAIKNIFTNKLNEEDQWTDDIKTKWEPREGIFLEKNPITIVNYLLKNSKDYSQAMKRLNFYMNRAGDNLKNKTVLNKAKALLKKRGKKLNENFENTILNAIKKGLEKSLNEQI